MCQFLHLFVSSLYPCIYFINSLPSLNPSVISIYSVICFVFLVQGRSGNMTVNVITKRNAKRLSGLGTQKILLASVTFPLTKISSPFFCLFSQSRGAGCLAHTEVVLRGSQIKDTLGPSGLRPSVTVAVLPHPALHGHGNQDPGNCPEAAAGLPLFYWPVPRSQHPHRDILGR